MVKTAASHAVNIGSNPVRVTSSSQAAYRSLPAKAESLLIPLLIASAHDRCAGSFAVVIVVQCRKRHCLRMTRLVLFHSQPLRWVARGERRENSKIALDKWKKRSIIEMFSGQPDDRYTKRAEQKPSEADFVRNIQLVLIAVRVHLFPSRTQKLSSLAPTILCGRLHGKIGNANTNIPP